MTNTRRSTTVWIGRVVAGLAVAAIAACGSSDNSSPETGPTTDNAAASGMPTAGAATPTSGPRTPGVMGPFAPTASTAKDARWTLYPQTAYIDYVKLEGNKMTCDDDTITAELKFGGTVMIYDTPVVTSPGSDEKVQFQANGPFAGLALVVNNSKGTNLPKVSLPAETTTISLRTADWGPINSITVCAGAQ